MSAIPRETSATPVLDRALDRTRAINFEVIAWAGLILLSVLTHLWALDKMALHHDESIHAWMSWKFFTGLGGSFQCAGVGVNSPTYCYNPVYHGPALYVLTLLSYFLFGDGNAQARLPEAVAGILMVASTWMLRPYLGRRGAFIAGVLLAFTPVLLYYTRFARHDGLIILFTYWMVIGFFRYLDDSRPGFLYLLAAAASLAVATHELYYILFFLFGSFVILRLLYERWSRPYLMVTLAVLTVIALVLEIWNPQLTPTLQAAGMAYLLMAVTLTGLLMCRLWDDRPMLSDRLRVLWYEQRTALWIALAIFAIIYVLLYTTFFTFPQGFFGPYYGLSHWLGSQQGYRRGDQPWYYYLMQMAIYEPLGFFGSIAATIYIFTRPGRHFRQLFNIRGARSQESVGANHSSPVQESGVEAEAGETSSDGNGQLASSTEAVPSAEPTPAVPLFPLFLAFWFIGSLVAFSWAGEKMPWLTIHIALPANLLAAWGIAQMLNVTVWRKLSDRRAWLLPPAIVLLLALLGVALWRLSPSGEGQAAQASLLQGIIPLALVGVLVYAILTIGQRIGYKIALALTGLTLAGMLGLYAIRSSWLVVYDHPDTPRELLVYVQSSPDVPLIANALYELGINQTRNVRTANDQAGGLTMPVIMDNGDENGEGSLGWPFNWYLRNFQRIEGRAASFFKDATHDSFMVDAPSGGEKILAPVVMAYTPHISEATRQALEQDYVKRWDSNLNWWFPEGNKCAPDQPGYKRFYYSASPAAEIRTGCNNPNIDVSTFGNVLSPFLWVTNPSNWSTIGRYLMYRDLPEPLHIDGREMEVWVRRDLVPGDGGGTTAAEAPVKLVAESVINAGGQAPIDEPRGIAVDAQGNRYVSNLTNHNVLVFGSDGALKQTIGSYGSGNGQFNEPRGIVIDPQGNIYVADTWNARIAKFSPTGEFIKSWGEGTTDFGGGRRATMTDGSQSDNEAKSLGFFGPRGLALDKQGNLYIADTGNKRIVVTDRDGKYLYQWGNPGAAPGSFNEPTSVAVDDTGNVYVADTWNGRVQAFAPGADGRINPTPWTTWRVPGWEPNSYDDPALAAGAKDQVFVTVPSRNQAIYFNSNGEPLLSWGGKGSDFASMDLPSGVAVGPDGNVSIVDRGNKRVLVFQMPKIAASQPQQAPAR